MVRAFFLATCLAGALYYHLTDPTGTSLSLTDTEENTTAYTYDRLNRLITTTNALSGMTVISYDALGNRLSVTDANTHTTTYLYDAANRLTRVDGVGYTFANNGNLLATGLLTNTFDAANRLIETTRAGTTLHPRYDGLGNRVGQTVGLSTTTFALDGQGLPEVISTSAGNAYLHLPGVIVVENGAGERRYLLPDGLGSVRQATDESGVVVGYHAFDPYGNPVANGGEPYGYTGEWWEEEVGLLYLRARWYRPETGSFVSRDAVEGEPPYLYARGNPVNQVDPSGSAPLPQSEPDPRDLTDWLYREMIDNANDPTVRKLKAMNELAKYLAEEVACNVVQAIATASLEGVPVGSVIQDALVADKYSIIGATALHGFALYEYSQLVKDGAIFDFKDEVGIKLGPGITLCAGACYNDIEYSVPDNIHFAYIGGASGIPGWEIQAGAGYAEITDPAHDPTNKQYVGGYEAPPLGQMIGWTPWNPSTLNFGDDPKDHEAVTLGIKLWEKYKATMTRSQFESELAGYIGKLSRCVPDSVPPREAVLRVWSNNGHNYPLGFFDNRGAVYKMLEGRCP